MQNQEIDKIKNLIAVSTILSPSEKAEWLALLGLMNDRQLAELEKILNSGAHAKPAPIVQKVLSDNKPVVSPFPAAPKKAAAPFKIPPLSHIVNLPKNFSGQPPVLPKPSSQGVSPEALAKRILQDKPQSQISGGAANFAAKLKSIFSEKELSAPAAAQKPQQPGSPKESPVPIISAAPVKPSTVPVKPIAPIIPKPINRVAEPIAQKPSTSSVEATPKVLEKIPGPLFPEKPQLQQAQVNISATSVNISGELKQPAQGAGQKTPIVGLKPPLQNLKPKIPSQVLNSGLNFSKTPAKNTEDLVAEIKQHAEFRKANPIPEVAAKTNPILPVAGLETLDSLTKMDLKVLQKNNMESLAAKIRLLTKQFGYFDVIFNIEKSPAYKFYIQTGLKLLSEQQDFEQLSHKDALGEYLSREQFEKFTDLLSKIQTS